MQRNEHGIGGDEGVDGEQPEAGRAVDDDYVVISLEGGKCPLQRRFAGAYGRESYIEQEGVVAGRQEVQSAGEGVVVDGTDVLAVYREAKRAIEKAREGGGPTLIECQTLRMEGHAVHDDAFYVPKELFERWAERDPVERFRSWLREHADLTDEQEDEISAGVKKLLNDALQRAEESPQPDPSTLHDGVFATPEDLDTPHHK